MPRSIGKKADLRPDLVTFREYDLEMQLQAYIGLLLMPAFNVDVRTGVFGKIPLEELIAAGDEKLERAAKSGYKRSDWGFKDDSYITKLRGVEEEIDDEESVIYGDYFNSELIAVSRCYDRLFSGYERRVLEQVIDATVTASRTTAATAVWSHDTNATPITDVKAAGQAMWERTGFWPNTLVINREVLRELKESQQIIDRMSGQGAGESSKPREITAAKLAELFDVDRVIIANAIKKGGSTRVSSLFPKTRAVLLRTAETNDLQEPCFGRTFVYKGVAGDFQPVPYTYRQEEIECDIVRLKHESQEKVLYPEMAQVITGVMA